jgi:hypothetical protein
MRSGRTPLARRQRGMAMLALVVLVTLVSTYAVSDALTRINAQVKTERENLSRQSMKEAKAALIAWSASQAWATNSNDQPGSLPCPDVNNDGLSDYTGNACTSQVGRLPWITIKAQDLRDASGEILWYAVSTNFRKYSGVTVINSDTQGLLTLYDDKANASTPTLTNVVAFVIAPGQAIAGQTRDPSNSSALNNVSNYLEGRNTGANGNYTSGPQSPLTYPDSFNDQLLPITQSELLSVVEPAVASRIERDIKPYINDYYAQWGAFPFPAIFASPDPGTSGSGTTRAQSAYLGSTTATSGGLIPITASATYSWSAPGSPVALTGGIAGSISGVSCTAVSGVGWRCSFTLNALNSVATCGSSTRYCMLNPVFTVDGNVANAGLSFVDLPDVSLVTVTNTSGSTARAVTSTTVTGTLSATGSGTVRFQGTHVYSNYRSTTFTRTMRVTIPDPTAHPITASGDATAGWFVSNEWYRQIYYALSPGYSPGGGASCAALPATPSCLTVNGLPASYAQINDKRAVLILGGRVLTASSRPSASLGNYFEGENTTPADYTFVHRAGLPTTINDRVVVIAP